MNIIDLVNEELKNDEPVELWNGIIEGSFGLITGVGKTGKTTMAENLAISFACGKKNYLNKPINCEPTKVLFINLEENGRLRFRRINKQISTLSSHEKNLLKVNFLSHSDGDIPEFLNSEADWSKVKTFIDSTDAKIIFMDSLTHMCDGDIERSKDARLLLERIKKYILTESKTFIFIHHNIKGNDRPADRFSIAGSRVVTQSFHYGITLSEIPSREGGNYGCIVFHKLIEHDPNQAFVYAQNQDRWLQFVEASNKFDLYKEAQMKTDGRRNSKIDPQIINYFRNQANQGIQTIAWADLLERFVKANVCSHDTLNKSLNRLIERKFLTKPEKALYRYIKEC